MTSNTSVWVTVLAGGAGTRFWPLSTSLRPKQLLNLVGRRPLIVDTLERVRGLAPPGNIRVLTGAHLAEPIRRATGLGDESILVETRARGTAPALARAAWEIARSDPDGVMISLHSDHLVSPEARFRDILASAADIARREDLLVTVAVSPNRAETGYGYIRPGEALSTPAEHAAYRVAAFVEKPGPEDAARYVADGYRWNSGIFVWRAAFFLAELETHAPGIAGALPALEHGDVATFFDRAESISVDEAILERSTRVAAIDATFDWDDIGGWEAIARLHPADADRNVRVGEAHVAGGQGNIAFADRGRVVLFGAEDMLVVRTDDMTLVMPRSELVRLKEHLKDLPARFTRTTDGGGVGSEAP